MQENGKPILPPLLRCDPGNHAPSVYVHAYVCTYVCIFNTNEIVNYCSVTFFSHLVTTIEGTDLPHAFELLYGMTIA